MSLILDALKKVEHQHRLGQVPGISATSLQPPPPRARWLARLSLGLLAVAMLGIGVYLGRGERLHTTAVEESAPPASTATALAAPAGPKRPAAPDTNPAPAIPASPEPPLRLASRQAAETSNSTPPALPEASGPAQPSIAAIPKAPPAATVPRPAKPRPGPAPVKSLAELPQGFVENLPQLDIDVHTYNPRARRSFVLINLHKYREGDYLQEGPLLAKIVPEGVVLEYLGERFLLPLRPH